MIATLDHRSAGGAEEIHGVFLTSYREEALLLGVEDFPPLRRTVEEVRGSPSRFLGWRDADRLLAVIELADGDAAELEIAGLAVDPKAFRRGLATRLLGHVLVRHAGRRIRVSTARRNRPALRLYAKLGFAAVESWRSPEGIEMVGLARR